MGFSDACMHLGPDEVGKKGGASLCQRERWCLHQMLQRHFWVFGNLITTVSIV